MPGQPSPSTGLLKTWPSRRRERPARRLSPFLSLSPLLRRVDRRNVPDLGDAAVYDAPDHDHVHRDRLVVERQAVAGLDDDQFVADRLDGDRLDPEGAFAKRADLLKEIPNAGEADIVALKVGQQRVEVAKDRVLGKDVLGRGDVVDVEPLDQRHVGMRIGHRPSPPYGAVIARL